MAAFLLMNSILLYGAAVLAVLSWLLPNHYAPWVSAHSEMAMAVALALAAASEWMRCQRVRDAITPLLTVTLLLTALPLLQWAAGLVIYTGDAWVVTGYLIGAAMAQVVGRRLAARFGAERVMEVLASVFIAAAIASVGIALCQWLGLDSLGVFAIDLPPRGRPFANLAQPNHLATLVFLGLVGTLMLYDRHRLSFGAAVLSVLFLEFGLVMTSSRTAWLSMAVLVMSLLLLGRRVALRMTRPEMVAMGVSFVALLLLWPQLSEALLLSAGRGFAEQASAGPRVALWQIALDAISREPWFGYGWSQTLMAHVRVAVDHPLAGRVLMGSAHNLFLDLMLWNGVLIGAGVSIFLSCWLIRHAMRCRSATAIYALMAIAGVFVHAMVEFPLSYAYFLFPVAMMMGVLDWHVEVEGWGKLPVGWFDGVCAAASVLLLMVVIDYASVEADTRALRFEAARIGVGRVESKSPKLMLLSQWEDYLRFSRTEAKPGMPDEELRWMLQVAERFPYSSPLFRSALAQGLNGHAETAHRELVRLCSMHTVKRCQDQLAVWRELARDKYPLLMRVQLPESGLGRP